MVWVGTLAIAGTLYFVKRNRPDRFMEHWGEFYRSPGVLSAASPDTVYRPCLLAYEIYFSGGEVHDRRSF
jgi:hypothetical protein